MVVPDSGTAVRFTNFAFVESPVKFTSSVTAALLMRHVFMPS